MFAFLTICGSVISRIYCNHRRVHLLNLDVVQGGAVADNDISISIIWSETANGTPLEQKKGNTVDIGYGEITSTMLNTLYTERGVLSVARFCYVFLCELRGPAWAVGSYSISQ